MFNDISGLIAIAMAARGNSPWLRRNGAPCCASKVMHILVGDSTVLSSPVPSVDVMIPR